MGIESKSRIIDQAWLCWVFKSKFPIVIYTSHSVWSPWLRLITILLLKSNINIIVALGKCSFYCLYHQFKYVSHYRLDACYDYKYDMAYMFDYIENLDILLKILRNLPCFVIVL